MFKNKIEKMKTIYIIFGFFIFCSYSGEAQNRRINLYTDADIIKLSNYIKNLEQKDSINTITIRQYEQELKELRAKEENATQNTSGKETTTEGN